MSYCRKYTETATHHTLRKNSLVLQSLAVSEPSMDDIRSALGEAKKRSSATLLRRKLSEAMAGAPKV